MDFVKALSRTLAVALVSVACSFAAETPAQDSVASPSDIAFSHVAVSVQGGEIYPWGDLLDVVENSVYVGMGLRYSYWEMESYSCLEEKNMFKSEYKFELKGVCESEFICNKEGVVKGLAEKIGEKITLQRESGKDELVEYNEKIWQRMCGWYHETFSHEDGPGGPGKPAELTCPSTNTLLKKKYDLTGCEVLK